MVFRALRSSKKPPASAECVELDVAFYKGFYADLAAYDEDAARLHWLRHGRGEGRIPSLRAMILDHPNFERLPHDFRPLSYVFHNRDLGRECWGAVAATRHYLDFGLDEGRRHATSFDDDALVAALHARAASVETGLDPRIVWGPRNVDEYLFAQGFSGATFLGRFDPAFYVDVAGLGRGHASFLDALFHFAEVGVAALLPIAEDLVFDPAFVRRNLQAPLPGADGTCTDVVLYRAWLSGSAFDTVPANHAVRMKERFGVACTSEGLIDLAAYRYANDDLRRLDDEALLEHVFTDGFGERRSSLKITPANLPFFLQHATFLEGEGATERAEVVYRRLLHFAPHAAQLAQQFGDHLMRSERFSEAYDLYRRNVEAGTASRWCFLNAATCCERLGDLRGAVEALAAGQRAFRDDLLIRRRWEAMAERFFADEWGFARALATAGRMSEAQERLYAATLPCHQPAESAAPTRTVRLVALVANTDLAQCTLYRVEQKAEQLALAGLEVRIYDWHRDLGAFERDMIDCDAVIFYRVAAFPRIARAIEAARAAGLATFYEIDDLIFDAAAFPEPLDSYGGLITSAEHVELGLGVPLFRRALELCDYAIASTDALAAHMEPLARRRRAFVHRNALGVRHERAMAKRASRPRDGGGPVTLFYGSGTKAHKRDFALLLLPALERIAARFGEAVRFVFAGYRPADVAGSAVLARATFLPFTPDAEDYWAAVGEADICLSVLRPGAANDAKSEIKWLEAAMFGLPTVASRTATFAAAVSDGVDGRLAEDADGFFDALVEIVGDAQRRRALGQAALAKARRDYRAPAMAANLQAIFAAVRAPDAPRTRVLVVNVFYPPQAKGGATRVVVDNIRDLRRLYPDTFEFEVFTTQEGASDAYGLEVYAFEGVRVTAMATTHYADIDLAPTDPRALDCFRRCVDRFAPDLIHFHCIQRITTSAAEVARARAIPYVVTVHDGWWISDSQFLHDRDGTAPVYAYGDPAPSLGGQGKRSHSRPAKLGPVLDAAEAVLAVSETFAEVYRRTGLRNVRTLANGLPDLGPAPSRTPARGKVRIAHLGGLEPHKGLPLLKRAILAARPRNLTALVVDLSMEPGDERIENWAGTAVRIVARQPQDAMGAVYADIDVLFAPSLWQESFGLVSREAVHAGCWVVASDRGAVAEPITEGRNGHVVSVDDASELVAVLRGIDADPARYQVAPAWRPTLRTSADQAADLAALYSAVVDRARADDARLAAE